MKLLLILIALVGSVSQARTVLCSNQNSQYVLLDFLPATDVTQKSLTDIYISGVTADASSYVLYNEDVSKIGTEIFARFENRNVKASGTPAHKVRYAEILYDQDFRTADVTLGAYRTYFKGAVPVRAMEFRNEIRVLHYTKCAEQDSTVPVAAVLAKFANAYELQKPVVYSNQESDGLRVINGLLKKL